MSGWISIKERLPDDDISVLIAMAEGDVWLGYLDGEVWRTVSGYVVNNVTHWQDLPEPPITQG